MSTLHLYHFNPPMDVFYAYTYSTAGWLSLQALPLLLAPNVVVTLLSPEARKSSGRLLKSCLLKLLHHHCAINESRG